MQLLLNCVYARIVLHINSQVNLNKEIKWGNCEKKKSSRNNCSRNSYLKTVIRLEASAAFERIVRGEKINHIQRKIKEHIHTRNRNAT